eukprot:COSAG01_NODE_3560_length_5928_cov_6.668209_5_plen_77_part_00
MRVSEAAVRATVVETELEGLKAARAQQQKKHAAALVQAVAAAEDEAVSGWHSATVATYIVGDSARVLARFLGWASV